MIEPLHQSLISALSKLNERFCEDPEALHFAVALVYSSIFKKNHFSCIVVGGQSAAYWLRVPGSTDVDFISPKTGEITEALEKAGFQKTQDFSFRYTHLETDVQIELVGEHIKIAGMVQPGTVIVDRDDIEDPVVQSLMPGPAEVLDPVSVFMNYLDSSSIDSIWFDFDDEGSLSIERAQALLALYNVHIRNRLDALHKNHEIPENLLWILSEKFRIAFT